MSPSRFFACGVLWLVLFSLFPAHAEVSLTTTGMSALTGSDVSVAEKSAFDDALFKAYLEVALRSVPASSSADLVQGLRAFVSSRGMQDVIQYSIATRSRLENILLLSMDFRLNDTPLKDWLQTRALTTPLALRPRVLLAFTTRGPGQTERAEWWSPDATKAYSPFETTLMKSLQDAGENIPPPPPHPPAVAAGKDRALVLGAAAGADIVVSGLLTHRSADALTLESRLDLSVTEVRTGKRLSSMGLTLKGTVDQPTMHRLLAAAVVDRVRAEIARTVVVVSPVVRDKTLCIEGISDHDTYQALIDALRSMDAVPRIAVSRIQGHTICHTMQIKGPLQDVLDALRQKRIAPADIVVDGDTAIIRLLDQ